MTENDRSGPAHDRFEFDFASWARFPLRLIGVTPDRCGIWLDGNRVRIRFGPWYTDFSHGNVRATKVTGPYWPWKVLGPRLSLADRGLTFGTSSGIGVCIQLWQPVPALLPGRLLRHPAITVTVVAPHRLAEQLRPHDHRIDPGTNDERP